MALCNLFLLAVIIQFYDDMFERNTEKKVVRYVSCILWYIFAFPISEIFHSVIIYLHLRQISQCNLIKGLESVRDSLWLNSILTYRIW